MCEDIASGRAFLVVRMGRAERRERYSREEVYIQVATEQRQIAGPAEHINILDYFISQKKWCVCEMSA